jgi:glycosyltransferase involved in cell wall biosynthesis
LKEKTHVVYNAIDTQVVQKKIAEAKNNDQIDIIIVGQLIDIKKQHILIKALNILAKRGLKPNLTLVGGPGKKDSIYYNKVKKLVSQLNLSKQVHFTGFVNEPYDLVHSAKISVLCCNIEGFGRVVAEAMFCKTPVVVPDAGGAGELIEDGITGLKFHPDSPESLANCLQRLLEDKNLRRKLSENAYKKACDLFTVDAHMQNLKREFVSLLNQT